MKRHPMDHICLVCNVEIYCEGYPCVKIHPGCKRLEDLFDKYD